jgi:hypothetical protein
LAVWTFFTDRAAYGHTSALPTGWSPSSSNGALDVSFDNSPYTLSNIELVPIPKPDQVEYEENSMGMAGINQ